MVEKSPDTHIKSIRKYLKLKILENNINFSGHNNERLHVYDLMKRSIKMGESHSALIIGPRGSGKTTLVNSVLHNIANEIDIKNDALIIKLNGLIHCDDKIALKAITAQMELENAVGDRVFGTFAENLQFLLNCIKTGTDRSCKSMLFILDEFHMFCRVNQTLLYNLFDIAHNQLAPVLVLGLTCRLDVLEKLEKRVKSRFSHRHIFLFPNEDLKGESVIDKYMCIFKDTLSLPLANCKGNSNVRKVKKPKKSTKKMKLQDIGTEFSEEDISDTETSMFALPKEILERCKVNLNDFNTLDSRLIIEWNENISRLTQDENVIDAIEKFCYYSVNQQLFKDVLYRVVCQLSASRPRVEARDVINAIDVTLTSEHRTVQLTSLSVLELSLLIAVKHQLEIFNGQPFNFEMLLHRYMKFANTNSSTQTVPRPVILKAFEHLQSLELITPIKNENIDNNGLQKEYRLLTLSIPVDEIMDAVSKYKNLPTEIMHWASSDVF